MRLDGWAAEFVLALLLLVPAQPSNSAPVAACGDVIRQGRCSVFVTHFPIGEFILADSLAPAGPEGYFIMGESYTAPPDCGGPADTTYLRNVVAVPCDYDSLGCGRINQVANEPVCYVWAPLSGDIPFSIPDLSGFAVGDTVLVRGIACRPCPTGAEACGNSAGVVAYMRISACPYSINPIHRDSWGQIKQVFR